MLHWPGVLQLRCCAALINRLTWHLIFVCGTGRGAQPAPVVGHLPAAGVVRRARLRRRGGLLRGGARRPAAGVAQPGRRQKVNDDFMRRSRLWGRSIAAESSQRIDCACGDMQQGRSMPCGWAADQGAAHAVPTSAARQNPAAGYVPRPLLWKAACITADKNQSWVPPPAALPFCYRRFQRPALQPPSRPASNQTTHPHPGPAARHEPVVD